MDHLTVPAGERREFDIDLPPEVAALVAAGGLLTYIEGPTIAEGEGCFRRELLFYIEDSFQGSVHLRWRTMAAGA